MLIIAQALAPDKARISSKLDYVTLNNNDLHLPIIFVE